MNHLDTLIQRVATGDDAALHSLYQETCSAVYGYALSILRNPHDAQDVMQDTYLRIIDAACHYSSQGKPLSWVLTIVKNLSLMKLRSSKRTADMPIEEEYFPADTPGLAREDAIVLHAALKHLDDIQRQIVILHAVNGMKHREIAQLLDVPLSTILSKYRRTLKKLRRILEEGES